MSRQPVTFQEALDLVESLSEAQQEDLIDFIGRRHAERHLGLFVQNIQEARSEYARTEVSRGTADELMKDLSRLERDLE